MSEKKLNPEQVEGQLAAIEGISGLAGHSINDPDSREILRQQAAGEITGDEARAKLRQLIIGTAEQS